MNDWLSGSIMLKRSCGQVPLLFTLRLFISIDLTFVQGSQPGRQSAAQDDTTAAHQSSFPLLQILRVTLRAAVWQVALWGTTLKENLHSWVVRMYSSFSLTVCIPQTFASLFYMAASAYFGCGCDSQALGVDIVWAFWFPPFQLFNLFPPFQLVFLWGCLIGVQVFRAGGACHFLGAISACGQEQPSLCPAAMTTHQVSDPSINPCDYDYPILLIINKGMNVSKFKATELSTTT